MVSPRVLMRLISTESSSVVRVVDCGSAYAPRKEAAFCCLRSGQPASAHCSLVKSSN